LQKMNFPLDGTQTYQTAQYHCNALEVISEKSRS
jgi:hypothetical protein